VAAAVVAVAGPGAPAFPVLVSLLAVACAAAVWRLGRRFGGPGAATVATAVAIVLVSLPNFEGDLFNAEVVGAVLVAWAVVLVTGPREPGRSWWRLPGAGALVALAVLFKAVFILDLAVVLAVPLWEARAAGRSWRAAWPSAARIGGGAAAVLGAAAVVLGAVGSLGASVDVLVSQDVRYVQLANGPGGSVLQSAGTGSRALYSALLLARVAVLLTGFGVLAWRASGRGRVPVAVVAWWLGCDLAGVMVSARGFSHYLQQAMPVGALAAAMCAGALWRRGAVGRIAAVLAVTATGPLLQLALFAPGASVAFADNRPLPRFEAGSFRASQVGRYYVLGYRRLAGAVSRASYEALFPTNMARQRAVVAVFRRYAPPGDPVYVWGTVHWSYALSDRVPAGRYASLNAAFLVDPGAQRRLVAELTAHPPSVLVVDVELPPEMIGLTRRLGYVRLPGAAAGDDVLLAPWASSGGPG